MVQLEPAGGRTSFTSDLLLLLVSSLLRDYTLPMIHTYKGGMKSLANP